MRRLESTWIGLTTIGLLALGCTDDGPGDDEVGETSTTTTTSGEGTDEGDATEGTTEGTDSSDEADTADGIETDGDDTAEGADTSDDADTSDGDPSGSGEFELVEAAFADEFGTLVLTFSDPVAPVDGVDPADFRVSMAMTMSYEYMGMQYDISYYADPNVYVDGDAMPIAMTAIAQGPNPNQISLTLDPVFDLAACATLEDTLADTPPDAMVEGHFFVHHAPGDIPLSFEGGPELAAIGPDWVMEPEISSYVATFGWPSLDPQIPIPCP
jgi:hypothetical protein